MAHNVQPTPNAKWPVPVGLVFLPTAEANTVEANGRAAGLSTYRVVLGEGDDKAALLGSVARSLSFPNWFRPNWDALADCLTDLSWLPANQRVLVVTTLPEPTAHGAADAEIFFNILAQAVYRWAATSTPLTVVFAVGLGGGAATIGR